MTMISSIMNAQLTRTKEHDSGASCGRNFGQVNSFGAQTRTRSIAAGVRHFLI